jgi:hypothetical protein
VVNQLQIRISVTVYNFALHFSSATTAITESRKIDSFVDIPWRCTLTIKGKKNTAGIRKVLILYISILRSKCSVSILCFLAVSLYLLQTLYNMIAYWQTTLQWCMLQFWFYIYGAQDPQWCTRGNWILNYISLFLLYLIKIQYITLW